MKKKIVAMCATVALAAMAVGGTLAWFTDSASVKNTIEVGEVAIEVSEERAGKLIPTVEDKVEDYLKKNVLVENIGNMDAYVRVVVAFEHTNGIAAKMGVKYDAEAVDYVYYSGKLADNVTLSDNKQYSVTSFIADKALAAGETLDTGMMVRLMESVTEADLADIDLDEYKILVVTQAVQADGWAEGTTNVQALNAAFGDIATMSQEELESLFAGCL